MISKKLCVEMRITSDNFDALHRTKGKLNDFFMKPLTSSDEYRRIVPAE